MPPTEIVSIKPLLAFLAPLAGIFFINFLRKNQNQVRRQLCCCFRQCALVFSMLPDALKGHFHVFTFMEILPGVHLRLRADPMGMIFAMVASSCDCHNFTALATCGD